MAGYDIKNSHVKYSAYFYNLWILLHVLKTLMVLTDGGNWLLLGEVADFLKKLGNLIHKNISGPIVIHVWGQKLSLKLRLLGIKVGKLFSKVSNWQWPVTTLSEYLHKLHFASFTLTETENRKGHNGYHQWLLVLSFSLVKDWVGNPCSQMHCKLLGLHQLLCTRKIIIVYVNHAYS